MKRIITLVAALIMTASVWAQSPEKMSYQAVVRNSGNALVASQAVGMQISLLQGGATGTAVYVETQNPTTNANGLVSLEIGTGTLVSGDFTTIDWANGAYFIKTETDPTGGTSYTITGTSQLMSVPYALYAKTSGSSIPGPQGLTGAQGIQGVSGNDGIDGINGTNGTNGVDGVQGPIGLTGNTGAQGIAGNNGTNGLDGNDGADGTGGNDGVDGTNGVDGTDGTNGTDGVDGLPGTDGTDGAQGPQGPQGEPGADGTIGLQGPVGIDGVSAYEIWIELGNTGTETDFINSLTPPIIESFCYQDEDGDGFGGYNNVVYSSNVPPGYVLNDLDCDDQESTANPDGVEVCDGFDNDCDGLIDEGFDQDGDGWPTCYDCDDTDPNINPDAFDIPGNPIDENCDNFFEPGECGNGILEFGEECDDENNLANDGCTNCIAYFDNDNDGFFSDVDCDDSNASVYPNATENIPCGLNNNGTQVQTCTNGVWVNTGSCITLAIGDVYQGGIIFYLDGSGGGLISAESNQTSAIWGCLGTVITTSEEIGTGNQNTIDIEAGCTTPQTAADICANLTLEGYSDWYLPSREELEEMYFKISIYSPLGNVGNFTGGLGKYWSSTESQGDCFDSQGVIYPCGTATAWCRRFGNTSGWQSSDSKDIQMLVRAIRSF